MARTLEQIKQSIILKKDELLPSLNNVSNTAVWLQIVNIVAFATLILEQMFDLFKVEITESIEANRLGQISYYVDTAKEWQSSEALNPLTNEYDTVNENLQIISRASATEVDLAGQRVVRLKIAKDEPPTTLTALELDDFSFYMTQKKFAGVLLDIVNQTADTLVITATVYYNGQVSSATAEEEVYSRIETYLSSVIQFNDNLVLNSLIAYIRESSIINNIRFTVFEIDGNSENTEYEAVSGYFTFDRASSGVNLIAE